MRERLRLNFNFRFGNKLHHQFHQEFFFLFLSKESNPSSFYIPSFIGAPMHMMHVRVHVRHLALMCYMWYMLIMSLILALKYENLHVKLQ